ncbi:hypothetical protein T484DRAFT_1842062, partial [Baffinella frigidus]
MGVLPEWLRGGQGGGRGGMRPKIGVQVSPCRDEKGRGGVDAQVGEGVAALIGAASVALFALRMPPVFSPAQATGSFWLTRILFLRALGLVYFTAFFVSFRQSKALIGDNGLLPARLFLKRAR